MLIQYNPKKHLKTCVWHNNEENFFKTINGHVLTFAGQIPQERGAEMTVCRKLKCHVPTFAGQDPWERDAEMKTSVPEVYEEVLSGSAPGHLVEEQKAGLRGAKLGGLSYNTAPWQSTVAGSLYSAASTDGTPKATEKGTPP